MKVGADHAWLPFALLSAVVLALEVFLSRLVSYSVPVILLYAVLGIAMMGFGAASSLVSSHPSWLEPNRVPRVTAWAAVALPVCIVLSSAVFVRLTPYMHKVDLVALCIAALLALPFFAAGVVVTLVLSTSQPRVGIAYAANLVGSGIGCFLPLVLLGPVDGSHFIGLLAVLSTPAAFLYVRRAHPQPRSALTGSLAAALALALGSLIGAQRVFPVQPEPLPLGQLAGQYAYAAKHGIKVSKRYDRWNPVGRIEIIQFDDVPGSPNPYPMLFYAQDSTAGSSLFRWDGRDKTEVRPTATSPGSIVSRLCSETIYGQAYYTPRSKAMIIGLGGGPDLECAVYQGVRTVDVVEINPDSIAAIKGPLRDWVGHAAQRPGVRLIRRDGRSFAHASRGHGYDMIQLSGVDTKQSLASGAHALSENQLYTREAFLDYFSSLSQHGVLSIIRFGAPEALRLLNTAVWALDKLGARQLERHFMVVRSGIAYGLIIGRSPIAPADVQALRAQLAPPYFRGVDIYYYSQNSVPLDEPAVWEYDPYSQGPHTQLGLLLRAATQGRAGPLLSQLPFDLRPATDDRPFFFDTTRYDRKQAWSAEHVIALRNVLGSVVLLAFLLILLPARKLATARSRGPRRALAPLFFTSIGLGYVLVEVWLLHTFAMYLGHQIYSLSVVLAGLLVSTGLGALFGERWLPAPGPRAALGALTLIVLLGFGLTALPNLLDVSWRAGIYARAGFVLCFVAPTGFALGLPFVAGLKWLRQRAQARLPWCIAINGFASVLASLGAIPLSMALGYAAVAKVAAALYGFAGLLGVVMHASPLIAKAPVTDASAP